MPRNAVSSKLYLFFLENLWDAKHLRGGIYFTEALPMLVSGKVSRKKAREIVNELYFEKNRNNLLGVSF